VAYICPHCDCNGIRVYSGGSYSGDGVSVPLASIREIKAIPAAAS
jgi:hypothetical protein